MRLFSLIGALIVTCSINAQVKLTPRTFDNGFKYPYAVVPANKSLEDTINAEVQSAIADLKASDFCIGEYGYVQKGSHMEIHMLCNCIDMQQSEHRYIFLNLETGKIVPHKNLFDSNKENDALSFIKKNVADYKAANQSCTDDFKALGDDLTYESIDIRLYKDGIEIRPAGSSNCNKNTLRITWAELNSYLRYNFL